MAMFINTNVSSLNAQRNLTNANKSLDSSYTRHSAPDLGINLPIALTQYLQNDLLVSC